MQRGSLLGQGLAVAIIGMALIAGFPPDAGPAMIGAVLFWGGLVVAAVGIGRLFT